MKPIFSGKVNVSKVASNPNNRKLYEGRIQKLERSMLDFVMDAQNPIILSTEASYK